MDKTPEEIAAEKTAADKAAADKAAADQAAAAKAAEDAAKQKDPLAAFDEYLETLDEETRTQIEGFTASLKKALVAERERNKGSKDAADRLAKYEAEEKKRKEADMTEVEKAKVAKQEADERARKAEEELTTERLKNAVLAAAVNEKFTDPEDAWTMIDRSDVKVDKDGKVTGVSEAIKALVKAKPYLVKTEEQHYDINGGDKGKGHRKTPVKPKIRF